MKMHKDILWFYLIGIILFLVLNCAEQKDTIGITTHPTEWNDEESEDFHGNAILTKSLSLNSCKSCHGEDYMGGSSKVSCFSSGCHTIFPHPEGWGDSTSANFHGLLVGKEPLYWNIIACQQCHGDDYKGDGWPQKDCTRCHTKPTGPEFCNTCHGSKDSFAPPLDLANNDATSETGVGAHQSHLTGMRWSENTQDCSNCHVVPTRYDQPGHVDNAPPPADITFSLFASDSGKTTPVWTHSTTSCQDVYCHGGFIFHKDSSANPWAYVDSVITGNMPVMNWTKVGTGQADCGTCHTLPPNGHITATTCDPCHPRVVDSNFNIIDKSLHINGKKDVF